MKAMNIFIGLLIVLSCSTTYVMGQNAGNHFVFDRFRDATILYKNKNESKTPLNYNKAMEEMIYISAEGKNMALYPINQIDTIYFGERKFVPVEKRFYEVLLQNNQYVLYASYRCRMSVRAQNIGYGSSSTTAVENISSLNSEGEVYQLKLPENYKSDPYVVYYIEKNGAELDKFSKVKELTRIFPDSKKEISSFIKQNKIKNNTEDIIEAVRFISNL